MQTMQTAIVIQIVSVAVIYLLLKWLPKKRKQMLISALLLKAPSLASMLKIPANDCSTACSSCGACAEISDVGKNHNQTKVIRIFSNSSEAN